MAKLLPTTFEPLRQPLETRILHLYAGTPTDPLTGHLECTSIDQAPSYEALSYEWACPEKTKQIILQNDSVLLITESLHNALRDLRYQDENRLIWADAICINQEDVSELSAQVAIMGQIYRRASQVVTYIGPEQDDSSEAIAFAQELDNNVWGRRRGRAEQVGPLPPASDLRWNALKALVLRQWVCILVPSQLD